MAKRVYVHPAPGLAKRQKIVAIGAGALFLLAVLAVQLRLTFSERVVAKAREELSVFGDTFAEGMSEAAPEPSRIDAMKDAIADIAAGLSAQVEAEATLDEAAAQAAAQLEIAPNDAAVPTEPTPEQPSTSSTTPANP